MNVVFMGTPEFAVPTLEALVKEHNVTAVVTQPDKPKGRGKKMMFSAVKEKALEYGLTVYQPEKVKNPEFVDILREINPDVIVVIAFGQILSKEILDLPKYGCINVHASLLPKYRGAAPIQWAVIDGEEETGVTTMYMAEGLDTGDVIDTAVIKLDEKETGGSLFDKLAIEGGKLIVETLSKLRCCSGKEGGLVTAGNASGINDGAAAIVVMSEEKAKELGVTPMATWVDGALAGVEPEIMGIGPVAATRKVMERTGLTVDDMDLIEANEAFAAQSVAVAKDLNFDMSKVNVNGGAIALGHPVGASGCRILVTLLHEMQKRDAKKGLATLCIGGGMGCATIVERD